MGFGKLRQKEDQEGEPGLPFIYFSPARHGVLKGQKKTTSSFSLKGDFSAKSRAQLSAGRLKSVEAGKNGGPAGQVDPEKGREPDG